MGVESFLKRVLDSAGNEVDLRQYRDGITVKLPNTRKRKRRNLRIGVDISHWIYKACFRFSAMLGEERHLSNYGRYQLVQQQQQQQQQQSSEDEQEQSLKKADPERVRHYVTSCCLFVIERLQSLQNETNADILVVLDGATPPIKRKTVQKRSLERKENAKIRDAPIDVAAVSKTGASEEQDLEMLNRERLKANRRAGAGQYYSDVVEELLVAMRTNEIAFLVAPYEADGQLAYLSKEKFIDIVITEDSDLVAQGAVCMLYKMDISIPNNNPYRGPRGDGNVKVSGSFLPRGILLQKDDLGAVTISHKHQNDKTTLSLMDMSAAVLAVLFVAAGSDYCEKLKGIGLVTACSIVHQSFLSENTQFEDSEEVTDQRPPLARVFDLLFQHTYDRSIQGDPEKQKQYKSNFLKALIMYRHPVVFDPFCKKFVVSDETEGDPELISYPPYRKLLEDPVRRAKIIGDLDRVDKSTATLMAEGWISPRTQEIYSSAKSAAVTIPKTLKLLLESQKAGRDSQDTVGEAERPSAPKDSSNLTTVDGGSASKVPQIDATMDDAYSQFASAESPEKAAEKDCRPCNSPPPSPTPIKSPQQTGVGLKRAIPPCPNERPQLKLPGKTVQNINFELADGGVDNSSSQESVQSVQYDTQMPMNKDIEMQEELPAGGLRPRNQRDKSPKNATDKKQGGVDSSSSEESFQSAQYDTQMPMNKDIEMQEELPEGGSTPRNQTDESPKNAIDKKQGGVDSSSSEESFQSAQYDTQMPMNKNIETQEELPSGDSTTRNQTDESPKNTTGKKQSDDEQGPLTQQDSDEGEVEELQAMILETQQEPHTNLETLQDSPDDQGPDFSQEQGHTGSTPQTQQDAEVIELLDSSDDDSSTSYEIDFVTVPKGATKTEKSDGS